VHTPFIIALSLGLVVLVEAAYLGIRSLLNRRSEELKRRLQTVGTAGAGGDNILRRARVANSKALGAMLTGLPLTTHTERMIEAADVSFTVAQIWGYSLLLAGGGAVMGLVLARGLLLTITLLCVGGAVPSLLLVAAADKRGRKLSEQLPEALDMMARSLRAGHAISSSLQLVATEMPTPVSIEFARIYEEQRLGLPLEEAIQHMTERSPKNRDCKIFAASTVVQKETGGNLAEILSGLAETIRARYRFEAKLAALTAEGRASAFVLSVLPVVFAVMLQVLSPGYLTPLVREPTGRAILVYAIVTWVVGIVWTYRLTKVDL
jgi:tight adherence protein B